MWFQRLRALSLFLGLFALGCLDARAGVAELLPVQSFGTGRALEAPVANAAFAPDEGALPAPGFTGILKIHPARMQTLPVLRHQMVRML